jgi:uncharacterized protein
MTMMGKWRSRLAAVWCLVAALLLAGAAAADADGLPVILPMGELTITTATGVYPFEVELADTMQERAVGLMYRRHMDRDHGMLFDMETTAEANFWMENTYISLDIIFIGEDGKVVSIIENAPTLSRALQRSGGPVRFVLELNAGLARKIGLKPGDKVSHPSIAAVAGQ